MSRYARKVDANQATIVAALESVGAKVVDLSRAGNGVPDLLVKFRGDVFLLECKTARGRLTPAQKVFHAHFPVKVVRDAIEALIAIGFEVER